MKHANLYRIHSIFRSMCACLCVCVWLIDAGADAGAGRMHYHSIWLISKTVNKTCILFAGINLQAAVKTSRKAIFIKKPNVDSMRYRDLWFLWHFNDSVLLIFGNLFCFDLSVVVFWGGPGHFRPFDCERAQAHTHTHTHPNRKHKRNIKNKEQICRSKKTAEIKKKKTFPDKKNADNQF